MITASKQGDLWAEPAPGAGARAGASPRRRRPPGSARGRSRQVPIRFAKLDKNGQRRGGKRKNAGRKRKDGAPRTRPGVPHRRRAEVDRRHPQHVTLRVLGDVGQLRTPHIYRAVNQALAVAANRVDFRIAHISLQGNHLHLLCEADGRVALTRGVKGFEVSLARRLNALLSRRRGARRRGAVFADRYHVRSIRTVRGTRNALSYVLNNWRHHQVRGGGLFDGRLDPYSSAVVFPGWRERTVAAIHIPPGYDPPAVCSPQSWLLREGWKRSKCVSCSTGSTFRDPDDALIYCAGCTPRPASRLSRAARTSSIASQQAL